MKKDIKNEITDKVEITISGRINNYTFGKLDVDYLNEMNKFISSRKKEDITVDELLQILFSLINNGDLEQSQLDYFESIKSNKLKYPNLSELYVDILNEKLYIGEFYDTLFCTTNPLVLFETDKYIKIEKNGQVLLKSQTLGDLYQSRSEEFYASETDSKKQKDIVKRVDTLIKLNENLQIYSEPMISYTKKGIILIRGSFTEESYEENCIEKNHITISEDNKAIYKFYIETNNFELSKLYFLVHDNADFFRGAVENTVINHMFYDNKIIEHQLHDFNQKYLGIEYEPKYNSLYNLMID